MEMMQQVGKGALPACHWHLLPLKLCQSTRVFVRDEPDIGRQLFISDKLLAIFL